MKVAFLLIIIYNANGATGVEKVEYTNFDTCEKVAKQLTRLMPRTIAANCYTK